jgi:hypothetical protein
MGRIDHRETASDQQYCRQGIHDEQEKQVEDIDKLNQQVALRSIQNGTGRKPLDSDEYA